MMMNRLSIVLLTAVMVFSAMGTASAAPANAAVKVEMDGKPVELGTNALMKNGIVYVEFRTIFSRLGYTAEYQKVSRTIVASTQGVKLQATAGQPMAYVNDRSVASKDAVIIYQGKVWVGLRFLANLSNYTVGWDSKLQTITLTSNGPTPQYIVNLYNVLGGFADAEKKGNVPGAKSFLATDAIVDFASLEAQMTKASVETSFFEQRVESYTDQIAEVFTIEQGARVGGGFFPTTKLQVHYTLHLDANGAWKIYDRKVEKQEYIDLMGAFKQEVTASAADKTAIGDIFMAQLKASNDENVDAYMATLANSGNVAVKQSIENLFKSTDRTNKVETWAIVEHTDNAAKIYASVITDSQSNGTTTSTRNYVVNDLVKVDGKWLLSDKADNLFMETVK
jgi:hypothetical protein